MSSRLLLAARFVLLRLAMATLTFLPVVGRPENKGGTLPSAVHYEEIEGNKYILTIDGIAGEPIRRVAFPGFYQTPMDYMPEIADFVSLEMDHEAGKCRITMSKKMESTNLSVAIDALAKFRGDIPCWAELEARDIKRAEDFRGDRYRLEKIHAEFPSGLAWFWLSTSQAFSAPFAIEGGIVRGCLLIAPKPVSRGSIYQYTIRLLDQSGDIIWMNAEAATGVVRVALGDVDGNGEHELYLGCNEHGVESRFYIHRAGPD